MSNAPAPDALRLVPVEPTEAMLRNAVGSMTIPSPGASTLARQFYRAMLAAAPAPATARGGHTEADIERAAQALVDHDWKGTQPPFNQKPAGWRDEYMARVNVVIAALASQPQATGGTVGREEIARLLVESPNDLATIAHSDPAHAIIAADTLSARILAALSAQPAPSLGDEVGCAECGLPYSHCSALAVGRMAAEGYLRECGLTGLDAGRTAKRLIPHRPQPAPSPGGDPSFLDAEAMAEAWSDRVEIQRMVETTSAVFAKWASPELLSRFRQQMMGVIQQAYIEGLSALPAAPSIQKGDEG